LIHVVLCDDHAILRRGIRDTLAEATDISVTAEAGSYSELRDALRTASCDVLLLDINMPGRSGLEVLASVRETHPQIRVIMVSMYPEDQYALRSIKAGAAGKYEVAGKLTIKGKTQDVVIPASYRQDAGGQVFEGVLPIKRTVYNIGDGEWKDTSVVADDVQIKFRIVTAARK